MFLFLQISTGGWTDYDILLWVIAFALPCLLEFLVNGSE